MTNDIGNLALGLVGLVIAIKVAKKVGAFTGSLVEKVKPNDKGGKMKW